jgi:hypothetical protein
MTVIFVFQLLYDGVALSKLRTFFSSPRNVIRVLAVALLCAGTFGQLMLRREAAPVADSKRYDVAMTFTTPAGETRQRVQVGDNQTFSVATDDQQGKLTASFLLTAAGPETVRLDGSYGCGGASAKQPPLTARLGAPTAIKPPTEGGAPACELVVVVTKLAPAGQG